MLRRLFTLTISCLILFSSNIMAQENESSLIRAKVKHGSLLLGGNLNGNYYITSQELQNGGKVDGQRINLMLRSKNGYFVKEDLVVGLDLSVLHQSTKLTSASDRPQEPSRQTFVLAGPFVRYYMINGVFGELTLLAGLNNFNDVNRKFKAYEGGVGIGYAHFINQQFSIEPILSFRYFQKTDRNDLSYREFGPMLGLGLQAYLFRQRSHVIKKGL
jgi:hypothetical protein